MTADQVSEMLQPMREVLNNLEDAAMNDARLSAKDLLDMAGKLTAVDLAFLDEYHRELIAEGEIRECLSQAESMKDRICRCGHKNCPLQPDGDE